MSRQDLIPGAAPTPPLPWERVRVSVVIPVGRDVGDLRGLHGAITRELESLERTHEVIFIADGVGGDTLEVLSDLEAAHDNVVLIRFRQTLSPNV